METRRAAAGFALLTLIYFLDHLLLGSVAPVRFHDIFDSEFGRFFHYGRDLFEHGFSTWWPALAGGMPTHAAHHGPLYPLALLTAWLPAWVVYRALVLGCFFLGGWGMYRFCREVLEVSPRAAWIGGVVYAILAQCGWKGLYVSYFVHLFPLFYVLLERLPARGEPGRRSSLLGLVALMVLAYPILTIHFAVPHLFLILVMDRAPQRYRRVVRALLLWGCFSLLNAPCLVSLLRYVPHAHRSPATIQALSFGEAFWKLIEVLNQHLLSEPRVQAMVLPLLLLTPWVVTRSAPVRRLVLFYLALIPLVLVDETQFRWLLAGTPLWRLELRHFELSGLALGAMVGALVVEHFWRLPPERQRMGLVAAALTVLVQLLSQRHWKWFLVLQAANLAVLSIVWAWAPRPEPSRLMVAGRRVVTVLAAVVILVSTRVHRSDLERHPFATAVPDFPDLQRLVEEAEEVGPVRVGAADIHPLTLHIRGFEALGGRSPLFYGPYKQLFGIVLAPQLQSREARAFFHDYWYNLLLDDAVATSVRGPRDSRSVRLEMMGAMNVRYLVSHRPIEDTRGLRLVARTPARPLPESLLDPLLRPEMDAKLPQHIYELENWLPRAYLVPRAHVAPSRLDVLGSLVRARFGDLSSRVYIAEEDLPEGGFPQGRWEPGAGKVRMVEYLPDALTLEVEAPGPGLVVVANNWHPGWSARLDGEAVPLVRANHAFQAISIPEKGSFRVELEHRDPWLRWLYGIQLVGFLGMVAVLLWFPVGGAIGATES